MKNLAFLLIFAGAFHFQIASQMLSRGNFMIGSTIGLSNTHSKVTNGGVEAPGLSARQFNISPAMGYFVVNHFALGLGADYTFNTVTEPGQDKTTDSDLLFGPFARLYIPAGSNVALFFVGNFGFGNSKDEQIIGEIKQSISTNIFAVGAGPGLTVYANQGFGIETILKYNFARSKFDTENAGVKTNTTTRTNQFVLSLGMQFYFGGIRRVQN